MQYHVPDQCTCTLVLVAIVCTAFVLQNGEQISMGFDYRKCTGLKVKPQRGDGLLFYSVFPNGTIDQVNFVLR